MKINFSKIAAAFLAGVMAFGSMGVSAQGAYEPVAGTNSSLDKYLIVKSDAAVPNVTFSFAIEPGEGIAADTDTVAVLAPTAANGVSGTPTIASTTFAPTDSKADSVASGDTVTLASGESYVKKTAAITLNNVTFSEPGVYRYKITESSDFDAIQMDTQAATPGSTVRYLDIYVTENEATGALQISGEVLHETASKVTPNSTAGSAGGNLSDKSTGYVNKYLSQNLKFGKEVTGNQGAKDKAFNFTLEITGAQANKTYQIVTNAPATSRSTPATKEANRGQENPATITTDEHGAATVNYYLTDGEYVEVKGLPKAATYAVSEDYEDYKQTAGIDASIGADSRAYSDAASGAIDSADIFTGFTNTRDGVIPTGVATAAGLGVGLAGLALVGALVSRKKEDED